MNKKLMIGGGVLGVFVGMGFVMPAFALLRDEGALPSFEIGCLLLGILLTLAGAAATVIGVKRRPA
jgi:hypothetical protein